MGVRAEVLPFLGVALALGVLVGVALAAARRRRAGLITGVALAAVFAAYFLYFFRDPVRVTPTDPLAVVAGAEGRIAGIVRQTPEQFRKAAEFAGLNTNDLAACFAGDVFRVSIFLSLFDVHVNRAPISGKSRFLGYFPGKHFFTFEEKSSDHNQHNSILFFNNQVCCLVNQIVGPVARRVVYWPDPGRDVELQAGAKIGMMKFGSRLDMYLPAEKVTILVETGAFVRAGETVIAKVRAE